MLFRPCGLPQSAASDVRASPTYRVTTLPGTNVELQMWAPRRVRPADGWPGRLAACGASIVQVRERGEEHTRMTQTVRKSAAYTNGSSGINYRHRHAGRPTRSGPSCVVDDQPSPPRQRSSQSADTYSTRDLSIGLSMPMQEAKAVPANRWFEMRPNGASDSADAASLATPT